MYCFIFWLRTLNEIHVSDYYNTIQLEFTIVYGLGRDGHSQPN